MDSDAAAQIVSFEVFDAAGNGLIGEIGIAKVTYRPRATTSLDGAAEGMVANLSRLDGVKRPTQSVRALKISGLDARWVSFEAARGNGKLGCEGLAMFDPKTNTLWTVQAVFGKRKSVLPLVGIDLDAERAAAVAVLTSVSRVTER